MTYYRGQYFPAHTCIGDSQPGALVLMEWLLGAYGSQGGRNGGIYDCRTIAGTRTLSTHAEGRALDLMTPLGNQWSASLARWLAVNSAELGMQEIIHRGQFWRCTEGNKWHPYSGTDNPHNNHIHMELIPAAARPIHAGGLSIDRINLVAHPVHRPTIRRGANGLNVTYLQQRLLRWKYAPGPVDGIFGPRTDAAVRRYQSDQDITVDGIVGPTTWNRLGV